MDDIEWSDVESEGNESEESDSTDEGPSSHEVLQVTSVNDYHDLLEVTTKDLVIVHWGASWSKLSHKLMPTYRNLSNEFHPENTVFLYLDVDNFKNTISDVQLRISKQVPLFEFYRNGSPCYDMLTKPTKQLLTTTIRDIHHKQKNGKLSTVKFQGTYQQTTSITYKRDTLSNILQKTKSGMEKAAGKMEKEIDRNKHLSKVFGKNSGKSTETKRVSGKSKEKEIDTPPRTRSSKPLQSGIPPRDQLSQQQPECPPLPPRNRSAQQKLEPPPLPPREQTILPQQKTAQSTPPESELETETEELEGPPEKNQRPPGQVSAFTLGPIPAIPPLDLLPPFFHTTYSRSELILMIEHLKYALRAILGNTVFMRNIAQGKIEYDDEKAKEAMTATAASCKQLKDITNLLKKIDSEDDTHNESQIALSTEASKTVAATVALLKKAQSIVAGEATQDVFEAAFVPVVQQVKIMTSLLTSINFEMGRYQFRIKNNNK